MTKKDRVLAATYNDLETARAIVQDLVDHDGIERGDIGLAVREDNSGEALVTVAVDSSLLSIASNILKRGEPIQQRTHEIEWRKDHDWRDSVPDVEEFTAVPLADE